MAVTQLLIDTLTKGARVALPFIQHMAEGGLSTSEISEGLKSAGLGVRRQDMLAIVRAVKDQVLLKPTVRSIRDSFRASAEVMTSPITNTLRRFSYRTTVRGRDPETGESKTLNITISSSQNLTIGAVKAKALEIADAMVSGTSSTRQDLAIEPDSAIVEGITDSSLKQGI